MAPSCTSIVAKRSILTLHSGSDTSNDRAPRSPGAIAQPVITEGSDAATEASAVRKTWRKSEDKDGRYQQTNGRYKKDRKDRVTVSSASSNSFLKDLNLLA